MKVEDHILWPSASSPPSAILSMELFPVLVPAAARWARIIPSDYISICGPLSLPLGSLIASFSVCVASFFFFKSVYLLLIHPQTLPEP